MSALLCRNMILPFCIQTTSGDEFALIRSVVGTDGDEDKAGMHERARRLMACWNATADIPVEALEAGVIGELVRSLEAIIAMQALRSGDASGTHMSLATLCEFVRETLAKIKGDA